MADGDPPVLTYKSAIGWSSQPNSPDDAENRVICPKSGLKVPLHDQVAVNGRIYASRYAPAPDRPNL